MEELRRKIRKSASDLSPYFRFSLHSLKSDEIKGVTGITIWESMSSGDILLEKMLNFEEK